ncbi:hypothetical protein OG985_48285 [Streptomyces sp. NBC_00289]|uniref:hypothetical protein n=1 Tax=Streptomyces sp. NBC_00289 TaxID=2975703 RepID=UPI00324AABD6
MPLRLAARYGIPLTQGAPAGPAAIQSVVPHTVRQTADAIRVEDRALKTVTDGRNLNEDAANQATSASPKVAPSDGEAPTDQWRVLPDSQYGITTTADAPSPPQQQPLPQDLELQDLFAPQSVEALAVDELSPANYPQSADAHSIHTPALHPRKAVKHRSPLHDAAPDPAGQEGPPRDQGSLTASDRYYLAWMEYQNAKDNEPTDEELSAYCAQKGLLGRGGKPISPANLRRHFLQWRIYNVWAQQRRRTPAPTPTDVAHSCTSQGITAQYNRPITSAHIAEWSPDFERRWQALTQS